MGMHKNNLIIGGDVPQSGISEVVFISKVSFVSNHYSHLRARQEERKKEEKN
jgi:hypothetical protein